MDALLLRLFDQESRIPRLLRAPYRGALSLFGLVLGWRGKLFLLAIVVILVAMTGVVRGLRLLGLLAVASIVAGAGAGAVSGVFEPLGRLGRLGEWFRWSFALFAYLAVLSLLLPPVPFGLPDPAFFWVAGGISAMGALALVLTDDRGRNRLPHHRFQLVRSLASHRTSPRLAWRTARSRLDRHEARRKALEAELGDRPEVREELLRLLGTMATELRGVHSGLRKYVSQGGAESDALAEATAWLSVIEYRLEQLRSQKPGPT